MHGVEKAAVKILFFANTDWYLYNFRLALARYLRELGHEVVLLAPPGAYCYKLEAAGFRVLTVPMQRRSLNPVREFALLNLVRCIYDQERPDLVHHFTIKCVIYGSLAAKSIGIKKQVNAVTGLGHVFTTDSLKTRLLRPAVRTLLRLAFSGPNNRLIVQNRDDQATFQEAGVIDATRIRLIRGSGVDTQRFRPVRRTECANSLKVLLASRLLWEKGVGEYVSAARQLRGEGVGAEFWLAGEPDLGNPSAIAARQIAEWGTACDVTIMGHVQDMAGLLSETDIAVLPSYGEGVPRSLIEAAACGLPLVATDAPGCREIVEHEVNGLLVPIKDASALATAVRRLCAEPDTRQRMGQASRSKVLDEFDERIVFEKTLAVYEELVH